MKQLKAGQIVRMVNSFEKVCAKADRFDDDGALYNGETLNPHFIRSDTRHDYNCYLYTGGRRLRVVDPAVNGNSYKVEIERVDGLNFWGGYKKVRVDRRLLKIVKDTA